MKNNTVKYVISEMCIYGTSKEMGKYKTIGELIACMYGDKVNKEIVKFVKEIKKPIFNYNYEPFEYEDLL